MKSETGVCQLSKWLESSEFGSNRTVLNSFEVNDSIPFNVSIYTQLVHQCGIVLGSFPFIPFHLFKTNPAFNSYGIDKLESV